MNSPLLSICIATYNQPQEMTSLLSSLEKQVTPEVEVVIRDDSPNEETRKIIEQYQKSFPIRYIKGEKIGLDRVIIDITKKATGKYVWWFGDDELVDGAVEYILEI